MLKSPKNDPKNEVFAFEILKFQTWKIPHSHIVLDPDKFKKTQKIHIWNSSCP